MVVEEQLISILEKGGPIVALGGWAIITFSKLLKQFLDKRNTVLEEAEKRKADAMERQIDLLKSMNNTVVEHRSSDSSDHNAIKSMVQAQNDALHHLITVMSTFFKENPLSALEKANTRLKND